MSAGRRPLERRYRRLLSWYPRVYGAEYGEEMLGVLMCDAGPERRWPAPAEVADLARGGAVAWLRRAGGGLRSGGWPAVGGVLGLLLPFAMVAYGLPADVGLVRLWPAYQGHHLEILFYLFYPETALIAWAVVLVLAVTRWRRGTVAVAWTLAAFQLVVFVARWPVGLVSSYEGCWPVVAVVAATALTIRGLRRAATGPLGPLGVVAGLAACLAAVLAYPPLHLTFPFVLVRRLLPGAFPVGRYATPVLAVLTAALLAVVAVRVTRRAGLGVMLRLVAVLAALGVLFLGGSLGSFAAPYLVARWLLGPALAFGLVLLGARLAERAHRAPGRSRDRRRVQ